MKQGMAGEAAAELDRVTVAETALSHGVAETGDLILRGHRLGDLVGTRSYEEVAALLWDGELPGRMGVAALGTARHEAFRRFAPLFAARPHGFDGLSVVETQRLLLASLPQTAMTPLLLVGAAGVAAAAGMRLAVGQEPVEPDPGLPHAADLLRMIQGREPGDEERDGLDVYLVSMIDHGVSASTFAARVVASTGAGLAAAAVAAHGALQGPLHGGAPALVLDMLDAIGTPDQADAWIAGALARGDRLMGFGSRAYRIRDPRADILKTALLKLGRRADGRVAFAEAVERAALKAVAAKRPDRVLQTNVEFYAALLLEALGVPRGGFTPLFAAARSAGWAAHVREQERTGRMLRPKSRYTGPAPRPSANTQDAGA